MKITGKKQYLKKFDKVGDNPYLQSYIYGSNPNWGLGESVSGIGDINGDSINDVVLSAKDASPNGIDKAGTAYVVYGSKGGIPNINSIEGYLSNTANGFKIYGSNGGWQLGRSVSGAGDINGDGVGDIVIGAVGVNPNGIEGAGAAYVIYGSRSGIPNINSIENYLSNTINGFKIYGSNENWYFGSSVSGVRDINGDGISDVIFGNDGSGSITAPETTYIIYGKKGGIPNINSIESYLSNTANGFKICDYELVSLGQSVSGAGDINGDGVSDIVLGAIYASPNGIIDAGAAYVVYGKKNGVPNINSIESYLSNTANGFKVYGSNKAWFISNVVSGIGDVNGDGVSDIAISASQTNPNGISFAGTVYVVYGHKNGVPNINSIEGYLSNKANGFKVYGSNEDWWLGSSVSGAGDVNSDGINDIVIGTSNANPNGLNNAGVAYIIYGNKSGIPNINSIESYLSSTINGFKVYGSNENWNLGGSVSGVGDVNDDGISDIVIGTYDGNPNELNDAGAAYIVYGKPADNPTDNQNYGMFSKGDGTFFSMNNKDGLGDIDIGNNAKWCKAESLYLGDFNGDKMTDLLCNRDGGQNYIMLSQGIGIGGSISFKPMNVSDAMGRISIGSNYNWCDNSYQRLLLGDFNDDNKVDLLCNNNNAVTTGQNYVMLSTGVNFKPMASSPDGAIQIGQAPGRFCGQNTNLIIGNFDGKPGDDLLCETYSLGFSLMVYNTTTFMPFDNSTGTVTMQSSYNKCSYTWVGSSDSKIITGDFNGDGKTDLLCKSDGQNYVLVSSIGNKGAVCTFSAIQCSSEYSGDNKCNEAGIITIPDGSINDWCRAPATIRSGDINVDGLSDLICNDRGYNAIMLTIRYTQEDDKPDYYQFESIHRDNPGDNGNVTVAGHEKWCLSGDLFIGNFSQYTVGDLWCNQDGQVVELI